MREKVFNKVSVFVLAISLIFVGIIPVINAQLVRKTTGDFLKIRRKDIQTSCGDGAEVPIWEIGDSWVFDIECSAAVESLFSFNLLMRNLCFEVTDDYYDSYKIDFCGEITGELSAVEPIEISGKLKDTVIEGYMLITQADLGIERIDAKVNGFVIVPVIPQIPFEGNITLIFNPVYDYLDFPISVGEKWEIPATDISMDLGFRIGGIEKSFHFDIPFWKDIVECLDRENVTVEAGTFEAFHISSTLGTSEFYYAPLLGNIIKVFENEEDFDFTWELKSTTYGGPEKPDRPSGPSSGKTGTEYTFTAVTTDPEGDQIYYLFEWGDGTNSGWKGPFDSGQTANATHIWTRRGNYNIKVKAKDVNGAESHWSDPLPVNMPRNKSQLLEREIQNQIHLCFIFSYGKGMCHSFPSPTHVTYINENAATYVINATTREAEITRGPHMIILLLFNGFGLFPPLGSIGGICVFGISAGMPIII